MTHNPRMAKEKPRRLDQELVTRGLFESRERAQAAILAGEIWVDGQKRDKASLPCPATAQIEHRGADRYVSRGGHKLEAALTHWHLNPAGLSCLDIGASTGGFTDCLLQHGAARVVALDVGHGQLHWKIRQDKRVEVHEHVNARFLTLEEWVPSGAPFPLIVTDVSFISLRLVLPPAFDLLAPKGNLVALIKPQFEAGREEAGRGGGVVRNETVRQQVVEGLLAWAGDQPVTSKGVIPSPIAGRDGNQEYLWLLEKR